MHLNECFGKESALSAVSCIATDWMGKSKTIFYIPDEAYAGYSYLYDQANGNQFQTRQSQQYSSNHAAHRRRHTFVHATEVSSLHHYHHQHYFQNRSVAVQNWDAKPTTIPPNILNHNASLINLGSQQHINAPITVPYMHPESGRPIPPLHLPWYFGALCFSFTLGGIIKLYWIPTWTRKGGGYAKGKYQRHWFPYLSFSWILALLQGPCSYFADYINMTNVSLWHLFDRLLACICMSLHLAETICSHRFTRPGIYLLSLACTAFAVFCFLKSQEAQIALDTDGFIFWHNMWHIFPFTSICVRWFEVTLDRRWGEYYQFKSDSHCNQREGKDVVLLSEVAMTPKTPRRSRRLAGKKPEFS